MKRFLATVGACLIVSGACSDAPVIDEVTIVNDGAYSANVAVDGGNREGWLPLTTVEPRSTRIVEEVIDQGGVWIFQFGYGDKHEEEIRISRRELEQDDWTVEVPPSFEERLRDLDVPPPP